MNVEKLFTVEYTSYHHGITGDPELKRSRMTLEEIDQHHVLMEHANCLNVFVKRHLIAFEDAEEREEFIRECDDCQVRTQKVI